MAAKPRSGFPIVFVWVVIESFRRLAEQQTDILFENEDELLAL